MRRTTAFAISAVLLPSALALSACSGSSTSNAAAGSSTSTSPAAAAATTTADPNTGLLTGTELKAALAPASYFPSGYSSNASSTRDTGASFQVPSVSAPASPDCTLFGSNGILTITGVSPVSFAQGDFIDSASSGEYAQEIDVFQGTAAQTDMTALAQAGKSCPTYQDSQTSSTAKVTDTTTTVAGDPALVFTSTDPAWSGGLTIEAVQAGHAVVTVMVSDNATDNGAPEATKLATTIVANLAGKS
jgi:hypothetical protein